MIPARPTPRTVHLVVPAYDPGPEFEAFLPALLSALSQAALPVRVQLVDDGSAWQGRERIEAVCRSCGPGFPALAPPLRLSSNSGKGAAIRAGWAAAGDVQWLGFVDADGSVPAHEVVRLLGRLPDEQGPVAVMASRIRMLGRTIDRKWHRHLVGRVFANLVCRWLDLPAHDTQCGLKLAPAAAWRGLAAGSQEDRFCFDVELLCLLRRAGVKLIEEPIDWADRGRSTVRLWRDIPAMYFGLLRLRRRFRGGTV